MGRRWHCARCCCAGCCTSSLQALWWTFALNTTFTLAQTAGATAANSLALLGDTGTMYVDSVTYAINIAAEYYKTRLGARRSAYVEVAASTISVLALLGVTAFVMWDAVARLKAPATGEEVDPIVMLVFTCFNLLVDIGMCASMILRKTGGVSDCLSHRCGCLSSCLRMASPLSAGSSGSGGGRQETRSKTHAGDQSRGSHASLPMNAELSETLVNDVASAAAAAAAAAGNGASSPRPVPPHSVPPQKMIGAASDGGSAHSAPKAPRRSLVARISTAAATPRGSKAAAVRYARMSNSQQQEEENDDQEGMEGRAEQANDRPQAVLGASARAADEGESADDGSVTDEEERQVWASLGLGADLQTDPQQTDPQHDPQQLHDEQRQQANGTRSDGLLAGGLIAEELEEALDLSTASELNLCSAFAHVLADTLRTFTVMGCALMVWLGGLDSETTDAVGSLVVCAVILVVAAYVALETSRQIRRLLLEDSSAAATSRKDSMHDSASGMTAV